MTVTIDASDARTIKALEIAAGASVWAKVRTRGGEVLVGIPSQCQPGRFYLVDEDRCDCADFKRYGLSRGRVGEQGSHHACKHILGLRLHLELVKAQQAKPKRRPPLPDNVIELAERYDRIFGKL